MLEVLQYAFVASLIGVVYAFVLPDDPTPLSRWYDLLSTWATKPVLQWFAYPLGYCAKCCSAHLAFWSLLIHGAPVINCLIAACLAVFIASALVKLYEWLN